MCLSEGRRLLASHRRSGGSRACTLQSLKRTRDCVAYGVLSDLGDNNIPACLFPIGGPLSLCCRPNSSLRGSMQSYCYAWSRMIDTSTTNCPEWLKREEGHRLHRGIIRGITVPIKTLQSRATRSYELVCMENECFVLLGEVRN